MRSADIADAIRSDRRMTYALVNEIDSALRFFEIHVSGLERSRMKIERQIGASLRGTMDSLKAAADKAEAHLEGWSAS